jgi:hypothetical protein
VSRFYVFNGDADGLCALQQLRLSAAGDATLVTGVKRDIRLLERVEARKDDEVIALDISLERNRDGVLRLLASGARVRYFDHHHSGLLPEHPRFEAHIDESPAECTATLVDRYLGGRHRLWAIAAAFGDGLRDLGATMAGAAGLNERNTATLEQLGVCLNYNSYGECLDELFLHPAVLADRMFPYSNPLEFARDSGECAQLRERFDADMNRARQIKPARELPGAMLFVLPNESWARRTSGILAHQLSHSRPDCAVAILLPRGAGGYIASVRVPINRNISAADFCCTFDTGGGRKLAAGVNHLPDAIADRFAKRFEAWFRAR